MMKYKRTQNMKKLDGVGPVDNRPFPDQTCTNTQNTSIPPWVLSFQDVFVNKFILMGNLFLLLFWPVSERLDLISSRYICDFCHVYFLILCIDICKVFFSPHVWPDKICQAKHSEALQDFSLI